MASLTRLRALTRPAHPIIPTRIPTRAYTLPQPRFTPPPARRHFEPAPLPPPPPTTLRKSGPERRLTGRQIPFSHVYVLDPDTNARSAAKQPLATLLAALDAAKARGSERRVVELVATSPDPIVRVTTRNEIEMRYKEMRRAMRKGEKVGDEPKEVQLTWGVGKADLEHKLRKAGRDLDKGYRVAVTVSVRHSCRPSSRQEFVAFGDEIAEVLGEVGRECKEREISNRSMVLSFRKAGGT